MSKTIANPEIGDIRTLMELKIQSGAVMSHVVSRFLSLYMEQRIEDADAEKDGDILQFEWGTYDWGSGRQFEVNLIRQVMKSSNNLNAVRNSKRQLIVSYSYESAEANDGLGSGSYWCQSPSMMNEFIDKFENSEPFQWASTEKPNSLTVQLI